MNRSLSGRKKLLVAIIVFCLLVFMVPYGLGCISEKGYRLILTAKLKGATVTLTATLTENRKPVGNALIHFCLCNRLGHVLREIGSRLTKRDGSATLQWSASSNGDYWFIAQYRAGGRTIDSR